MNKKILLFLAISLLAIYNVSGQGLVCEESDPFCTGSIYTFPAGTTGSAQPGAYYGCLTTQPAPAWYHMLIDNPGPITIYMYSTPLVDIDFICWGPFADPYVPCVEGLTSSTVVDCSYSPNPTEYCDIPNGQTGQYYILLITNYSQQACNITFSQTGGSGSTDCTILPPLVGNDGPLCVGDTLHLYAANVANATYLWTGPDGFFSNLQNPVIPNVTLAKAGDYSCVITISGQESDPAITSVVIYSLPSATLLTGDTAVCTGDAALAIFQFSGWGPFKITYNNGSSTFVANGLTPPRDTIFLYPAAPTTYTFTKVEDLHCSRNLLFLDMITDVYPATTGVLSGSTEICAGEPADLLFNLTGTPPWNIAYTVNGGSPQYEAANTSPHTMTVYPTVTSTYVISNIEDINCDGEASGEAVVLVNPSPTSNAGTDQTIPFGTSTTLSGNVTNGSGNYSYAWSPADKLVNPNVQQPQTINLNESTNFTLTGTDNDGGCFDLDDVLVTVTGGPLGCFPSANPPAVCSGDPSQLLAGASGGSGSYTYLWSSNPPGFSSSLYNPVVTPTQTTTYYVTINDGYNITNGNVTVNMQPLPVPDAGSDIIIAHGTNTVLQGSASGGSGNYGYHWEPADKLDNADIYNPHTVNLYETTLFTLYITDLTTGCESEDPGQMAVIIDGDALAVFAESDPQAICYGGSAQLNATGTGGAGTYTYSWVCSNGFTSNIQNPVLTPQTAGSIICTCTADDSFNEAEGSVVLNVNAVPFVVFGYTDTTICVFDTVTLNAGNQPSGSTFLWSNGSTSQSIDIATTGIGFDLQTYSVTVTNQSGCSSETSVNVAFDFSACTGVNENGSNICRIYPNPGNGIIHLLPEAGTRELVVSVNSGIGKIVWGPVRFDAKDLDREITINLGEYQAGMYFIQVQDENGSSVVSKYILK